jgi:predicted aspartyl protease
MTREETVAQTLIDRGFTGFQAKKIAHEIIRNLIAYSRIQDQRQQYFSELTRKVQR